MRSCKKFCYPFPLELCIAARKVGAAHALFLPRLGTQGRVGSVIVTLLALLVFGYIKGRFTTARPFRSAWQTIIVGGLAATAAFVIAKVIG
jgi:VIT1/CCC1 family predicted Fe2+/Mn2+ transporter